MTDSRDQNPVNMLDDYARLISSLVHDLRTPLTSIIGAGSSLALYADRFDTATQQKLLQSIIDEAEHLDRMLSNLALIAKIRSGVLKPNRRPMRLHELLNGTAEKVNRREDNSHLRLADDVPNIALEVDPALLQNAMLNLLEITARFSLSDTPAPLTAALRDGHLAVAWTMPVTAVGRAKIARLLNVFGTDRRDNSTRASDLILLEATQEVVQSHGGKLSITCSEANAIDVVVELPVESRQ